MEVITIAILCAGLACAVISGRIVLLAQRGGILSEMNARQGPVSLLVGALVLPAQILLIVFGFFIFEWWLWIAVALFIVAISGALVSAGRFPAFVSIYLPLALLSLIAAAILWIDHLEFASILN